MGAGVAKKLDVPVFMDADANEADTEKAYGQKCTHKIVHPELCFLFGLLPSMITWEVL